MCQAHRLQVIAAERLDKKRQKNFYEGGGMGRGPGSKESPETETKDGGGEIRAIKAYSPRSGSTLKSRA